MMRCPCLLGIVFMLAAWARPSVANAQSEPDRPRGHRVDRIVAIVDDDIVTAYELEQKAQSHMEALPPEADKKARRRARRAVLERVLDEEITEWLLKREVQNNKDRLGVSDKDIDRAIDEVVSQNRIDRDQLQTALIGQHMTMAEYRDKMREQIERARLMQFKVQSKVHVREQDVQRTCRERERLGADDGQVCAGHVLLALPPEPTAEELANLTAKAEEVRRRVEEHDFEHGGSTVAPTLSLGVASYPEDGETRAALTRAADAALYRAKKLGGDAVSA